MASSPAGSSPGSLSSTSSGSNSEDRVAPTPASPPPFLALSSPKAAATTSTKPPLLAHSSNISVNPQPFFPVSDTPHPTASPTTYQFPVVEQIAPQQQHRLVRAATIRTPSPPTVAQRQARPTRVRRQSTQYAPAGPTSPGAPTGDVTNQLEAKVVILGSQGVGKTSIVHRYTSGHFSYSLSSTIGASFLTKKLVVDSCKVRLQIWDTAGQERFRSMAPLYYRGALAAILVYDITNADSFNDVKIWLEELRRNMSPDLIIHVVGSKGDLAPSHRQVNLADARRSIAGWVDEARTLEELGSNIRRERDTSPPSPTRTRTLDSRRGSILGSANTSSTNVPTITTSPPPLDTLGARVRKMSTKLGTAPSVAGGGGPTSGNSTASSSVSELGQLDRVTAPGEMVRSTSKLSLSLSGLGMSSTSSRGRKSAEEERKAAEEAERARLDELVKDCGVEVSEVSAKDDYGIEDLFLLITRRLVERKAKIESDRVLRSRDSIMLRDNDDEASAVKQGWCC